MSCPLRRLSCSRSFDRLLGSQLVNLPLQAISLPHQLRARTLKSLNLFGGGSFATSLNFLQKTQMSTREQEVGRTEDRLEDGHGGREFGTTFHEKTQDDKYGG